MQLLLEPEQTLALLGGQLRDRNPGRSGDDLGDVLRFYLGRPLPPASPLLELALPVVELVA